MKTKAVRVDHNTTVKVEGKTATEADKYMCAAIKKYDYWRRCFIRRRVVGTHMFTFTE